MMANTGLLTEKMKDLSLALVTQLVELDRDTTSFRDVTTDSLNRLKACTEASTKQIHKAMQAISDSLTILETATAERSGVIAKMIDVLERCDAQIQNTIDKNLNEIEATEDGMRRAHSDPSKLKRWPMIFIYDVPIGWSSTQVREHIAALGVVVDFMFLPSWRMALATMSDESAAEEVINFVAHQGSFKATWASDRIDANTVSQLLKYADR